MKTLANYDPNLNWSIHTVEVTIQQWDYSATFRYEVRGNVTGFDSMDDAPDNLFEEWFHKAKKGEKVEGVEMVDEECAEITLTKADGSTLECEIWDYRELERMITGVRIVEAKPLEEKERAS